MSKVVITINDSTDKYHAIELIKEAFENRLHDDSVMILKTTERKPEDCDVPPEVSS